MQAQLRGLQQQLGRCQAAQAEAQAEVGHMLDQLAASRKAHDQVRAGCSGRTVARG